MNQPKKTRMQVVGISMAPDVEKIVREWAERDNRSFSGMVCQIVREWHDYKNRDHEPKPAIVE